MSFLKAEYYKPTSTVNLIKTLDKDTKILHPAI